MNEYRDLFQRTFSHLEISPALSEKLSAITETAGKDKKPKRFILRRLTVTAVILALAVVLTVGANAATGGELYEATIGRLMHIYALDDGGRARLYHNENGGVTVIEYPEDGDESGLCADFRQLLSAFFPDFCFDLRAVSYAEKMAG